MSSGLGTLAKGHSDARGPTTCSATLVMDNPGLPRAPPDAQYLGSPPATHPPLPTRPFAQTEITGWAGKCRRGTRLHGRHSVSVSSLFPSQMQHCHSSAGGNPVRQLYRAGELIGGRPSRNTQEQGRSPPSTVGRPSSVVFKDGRPRHKAVQEGKADKDMDVSRRDQIRC
jgi:hypothetical protein